MRLSIVLGVVLVGCGSAETPQVNEPADANVSVDTLDAVVDETTALDTGSPIADTSRPDTTPDTTPIDTGVEGGVDTATADTGPLGLLCSRSTEGFWCGEEQACCWNEEFGSGLCKSIFTSCASGSVRINCAGSRDCAAGKVCCGSFLNSGRLMNASCATSCAPATDTTYSREVCSWAIPTAGECPAGKKCLGGDRPFGFCM